MDKGGQRYHFEHVIMIFLLVVLVFLVSLLIKAPSAQVEEGKFLIPTHLLQEGETQVLATHSSTIKH